ncbi:MAG TPA: hypothetical protein VEJ84_03380 [Acidimicrobiales bacterium]|nr:hypothetical protein [Acidimicrobiales bacterium]
MSTRLIKHLSALAVTTATLHGAVLPNMAYQHNTQAQISFEVPKTWTTANEKVLFEQGFIVPPLPLYAFVAAPTTVPSHVVLNSSPVPWLFVTVETVTDPVPPSQLYEQAPQYIQQLTEENGNAVSSVRALVPHHVVHQGGLSGSAGAFMVVAPGDSTSFDEVAYGKGSQLWLVMAGCSAYCYYHNEKPITQIVDSVRVGLTASS